MAMEIGVIGTSIWQQNMPLLERLTIASDDRNVELQSLKEALGVSELIYLATCNRIEFIYTVGANGSENSILPRLIDFFFAGKKDISFFPSDFYQYSGRDAITHIFRMSSSLESLVIGETQITSQFKQAAQQAKMNQLSGTVLNHLADEALLVARTVRRETSLGSGSVSMASLASAELCDQLSKEKLANTEKTLQIAIVGSGGMTPKLARHLKKMLSVEFIFVNRTLSSAQKYSSEFGGKAILLEEFQKNPMQVNGIVSATSSSTPIFDSNFLNLLPNSGQRVICIDLAIPHDFSAEFDKSPKVTLIDISTLKLRVRGNLRKKFKQANDANQIVRDAVSRYLANRIEISLKPIFQDCYRESVAMAKQALDDLFNNRVTSLQADEQEAVHRLVAKLIGHSAYQPAKVLSGKLAAKQSSVIVGQTEVFSSESQ